MKDIVPPDDYARASAAIADLRASVMDRDAKLQVHCRKFLRCLEHIHRDRNMELENILKDDLVFIETLDARYLPIDKHVEVVAADIEGDCETGHILNKKVKRCVYQMKKEAVEA